MGGQTGFPEQQQGFRTGDFTSSDEKALAHAIVVSKRYYIYDEA